MNRKELQLIAQRVAQKKEQLSREKLPTPEEKELLKEVVGEKIEKESFTAPPVKKVEEGIAPSLIYPQNLSSVITPDIKETLQQLIEIALDKGVEPAITLARKTGNAFLLDTFRDELAFKYYSKLKELKML